MGAGAAMAPSSLWCVSSRLVLLFFSPRPTTSAAALGVYYPSPSVVELVPLRHEPVLEVEPLRHEPLGLRADLRQHLRKERRTRGARRRRRQQLRAGFSLHLRQPRIARRRQEAPLARACSWRCVLEAMMDLAKTLKGLPSPLVTFPPASVRTSAPAAMSQGLSWYSQ